MAIGYVEMKTSFNATVFLLDVMSLSRNYFYKNVVPFHRQAYLLHNEVTEIFHEQCSA